MSTTKTERLMNLVIMLLVAPRPLTKAHIRNTVEDYRSAKSEEAFEKMFERDKDDLRALGIPVSVEYTDKFFDDEQGYRIDRGAFELPAVEFDADEVAVIGVAARVWEHAGLAASTADAIVKLRATGVAVDTEVLGDLRPTVDAREPAFEPMLEATRERRTVTFDYRRPGAESTTRRLQPWGVITSRGRWYVVGHDLDRGEERMFRLSRVEGEVTKVGKAGAYEVPEGTDIRALSRTLAGPPGTPATLLVRTGSAQGLRRWADEIEINAEPGWDRVVLPARPLYSLTRSVLEWGDAVRVLEPADLRESVILSLKGMAQGGVR